MISKIAKILTISLLINCMHINAKGDSLIAPIILKSDLERLSSGVRKEALEWNSQYFLALQYLEKVDTQEKGINILHNLAAQNHIHSNTLLGLLYFRGILVEKSIIESKKFTLVSQSRGDPIATHNLGAIYLNTDDFAGAEAMLIQASEMGLGQSQHLLGSMYYKGDKLKKNVEQSKVYLSMAAKNNQPRAAFILGMMFITEEFGKENKFQAIEYLSIAAKGGHSKAQYNLGLAYYSGDNVEKSFEQALYWLEKSFENGMEDAQFLIAKIKDET